MLASMSETSWSDPDIGFDMSELPTGTVTLLLADVEGSTRLWETQPEAMKAAVERLDQTLSDAVAANHGVRPVEQGEGDSFVIAFARAADAVACALDLQRAPLAPIKLRIGVHTGDVHLRDEGNYIGPTINRTARLRDLAHGGQTVLVGRDGTACRRPTPARRHAQRPRPPSAARPAPPGTGGPAVPSRICTTTSRRCDSPSACRGTSSSAADEFHRAPSGNEGYPQRHRRQPARHADRRGRRGQDAAGRYRSPPTSPPSSPTAFGMSTWRRSPIPTWCP